MKISGFRCETKFGLLGFLGHPNQQQHLMGPLILCLQDSPGDHKGPMRLGELFRGPRGSKGNPRGPRE